MDKEQAWLKERLGRITASELNEVVSASGKWIDGNVDYIRHKRFERKHGYRLPISGRALTIGKEQEPYAIAWLREHIDANAIYAQELPLIPIWVSDDMPFFAASPDAYNEDQSVVYEMKCLVGNTNIEFFADESTLYEDKKAFVKKEHGNQLAGQFLANPKVKEIVVVKYIPQNDEIDDDVDSPLAVWRGNVFSFIREDFDLKTVEDKVRAINLWIDSDIDPKLIKKDWYVENGAIVIGKKEDAA